MARSSPPRRRSASPARSTIPVFPCNAIELLPRERGNRLDDVDYVVFYDKPFLKFERLLETYLAFAPRGFRSFRMAMPALVAREAVPEGPAAQGTDGDSRRTSTGTELLFTEHHLSHAASAFYPFARSRRRPILTMDGVGEWATTSAGSDGATNSSMRKEIHFPHSLGLLYSAFTYYTGFKVNSGEYKVMGLAPYGEPKYAADDPRSICIDVKADGSFRLDHALFRLLHRPDA